MPHITDIPVDTLLDNLLPCITVPDLLNLACTNRFFATLLADELFWKRKLKGDFNFTGAGTARTTNWKLLYRGLRNPKVYVWGYVDFRVSHHPPCLTICSEKSMGRLGLKPYPKSVGPGVPFPTELHIPGVRIVNLIAGGM
jgi:SCF-associated factor 1